MNALSEDEQEGFSLREISKQKALSASMMAKQGIVDEVPIEEYSRSLLETFRNKKTLSSIIIHEQAPIKKLRLAHRDAKFCYLQPDTVKVIETANMTNEMLVLNRNGIQAFGAGQSE